MLNKRILSPTYFQQIQVMFIIPLTVSFQIDPDKTKCGGAKFQDDNVSDNASFVSMSCLSCLKSITGIWVIMQVNILSKTWKNRHF